MEGRVRPDDALHAAPTGALLVRARGRLRSRGRAGYIRELHRSVAAGRVRTGRRPRAEAPRHAPPDEGSLDLRAALPHRRLLVRAPLDRPLADDGEAPGLAALAKLVLVEPLGPAADV